MFTGNSNDISNKNATRNINTKSNDKISNLNVNHKNNLKNSFEKLYLTSDLSYIKNNQTGISIKIEDLIIIEEKLFDILNKINEKKICYHECFDWWNLYFNCSLCGSFEHYFNDTSNKQIIREYVLMEMITISISYNSCIDDKFYIEINYLLKILFNLLHENFIILCDYFICKISKETDENEWVLKLEELIHKNFKSKSKNN